MRAKISSSLIFISFFFHLTLNSAAQQAPPVSRSQISVSDYVLLQADVPTTVDLSSWNGEWNTNDNGTSCISNDGVNWTPFFINDGNIFGGSDGKFLRVSLKGSPARFVRLQLNETNWLHLDEVEIY